MIKRMKGMKGEQTIKRRKELKKKKKKKNCIEILADERR
jgi:hypothetical protein